jgi:hypothetical protein
LRGDPDAVQLLRELGRRARLGISVVTHLEVHAGMRSHEEYPTRRLLARFTAYVVDRSVAERAGEILRRYPDRGIGVSDAIIAATAIQHGLTLVTLNARHFPASELTLYSPNE